jgi:hypothetical protein
VLGNPNGARGRYQAATTGPYKNLTFVQWLYATKTAKNNYRCSRHQHSVPTQLAAAPSALVRLVRVITIAIHTVQTRAQTALFCQTNPFFSHVHRPRPGQLGERLWADVESA